MLPYIQEHAQNNHYSTIIDKYIIPYIPKQSETALKYESCHNFQNPEHPENPKWRVLEKCTLERGKKP